MATDMKILPRSEMNPDFCWNTKDLYESDEKWREAFEAIKPLADRVGAYKGTLGRDAATLLAYLQASEELSETIERLYCYTMLRADEDTKNSAYQAMQGQIAGWLVQFSSATAFDTPEIIAIPDETLAGFMESEPALKKYERHLTRIRLTKDHVLSEKEESLLAAAGEMASAPQKIFMTFNNADMKFPSVKDSEGKEYALTNGSYISLVESGDRVLRENAFKEFYRVYASYNHTMGAMLNAETKKSSFYAKARRYESARQGSLSANEVPEQVYDSLIAAVHKNLPHMYRYMALRKKAMRLDELHMYDLYVGMLPEADKEVPFETAREEVLASVKVMGEEYHAVMKQAFESRWIDIYENEGKRSGAYSCGTPVHPFVLLNYKNTLDSEFTLAHEMGHAMHSYLSSHHQPAIYSDYVLFVAEVASTCNEALLMQHLLGKTSDKTQRAILINYFLEQFRTTLYRQTMFAEFEQKVHAMSGAGETLTGEVLNEIYLELNKLYYGENVISDDEIAYEWSRIPHFYRPFYVYQYATGFSAAMALSQRILKGGPEAVNDYLNFLKGGCSTDPISLLKIAGVDMGTPAPVEEALALFGSLVDELETLL